MRKQFENLLKKFLSKVSLSITLFSISKSFKMSQALVDGSEKKLLRITSSNSRPWNQINWLPKNQVTFASQSVYHWACFSKGGSFFLLSWSLTMIAWLQPNSIGYPNFLDFVNVYGSWMFLLQIKKTTKYPS